MARRTSGGIDANQVAQGELRLLHQLAREAIRIEQEVIGESVGSQDQIWAAFGGTSVITFRRDGGFEVTPVIMPRARLAALEACLLLFFTGFSRIAATVAAKKIANLPQRGRSAHDQIEIARLIAIAVDTAAIGPDLGVRHMLAQYRGGGNGHGASSFHRSRRRGAVSVHWNNHGASPLRRAS